MDTEQIKIDYMDKYNILLQEFKAENVNLLVSELNDAIAKSKIEQVNQLYNNVLNWNNKVAGLEAIRDAINARFSYLRLPSVKSMAIILDGEEKIWKFNTDAI